MKDKTTNEGGFILLAVLILMVLIAVTALTLNSRASLQARMSANQAEAVQIALGQVSVMEQALWQLTRDPRWRTDAAGESAAYNGVAYNRKVLDSTVSGYTDAFTVSVTPPGGLRAMKNSFRYFTDTPFLVRKPYQVFCDNSGNSYFADADNHSVWKIAAADGAITRMAGNGTSGFSGDGGPATQAQLNTPKGVAVDVAGNLYIADTSNCRIRKVNTYGQISTYAGTGVCDYSGDGGQATAAKLKNPAGVFADPSGNIYIADTSNCMIRKIVPSGVISTVAGKSSCGYDSDGLAATAAKLNYPEGVFVNPSGDIYIGDTNNHRVRKVTAGTGVITTVAGTGVPGSLGDLGLATNAQLKNPGGVFVDASGNIYIADTVNSKIRWVNATTQIITTIAGTGTAGYSGDGGLAINANLDHPQGVFCKNTGEMIIADTMNSCLRTVSSGIISTPSVTANIGLNSPGKVALYYDSASRKQYLIIADTNNSRVHKMDTATRSLVTVAGTGSMGDAGDGGLAVNAQLKKPQGLFADASGNIYISDTESNRIRKVTAATGVITTVAGTGFSGYTGDGGLAVDARINSPGGVFVDVSGNIYIADANSNCIRKVTAATGVITTVAGTGSSGYSGDGVLATGAKLQNPQGIFLDASGNMYIADTGNSCIRKVTAATGVISTVAGTGTFGYSGEGGPAVSAKLNKPKGISVDGAGNIYIADTNNHIIRIVSVYDGNIYALAGIGGASGFNGDVRPAINANLNSPSGVALALSLGGGRIYISDTSNNRIRLLYFQKVKELY